jgi:predicted transcriptional regulator
MLKVLTIRDFMTREVLTLAPNDTLRDAIELFTAHHITGAPVVEHGAVVGVLSVMDVADVAAQHVMAEAELTQPWADDDDGSDAARETASYFTQAVASDDSGTLYELRRMGELPGEALDEVTVADAMTRTLADLGPDTELHEAAQFMLDRGIHRALVVEDGVLRGLVTTTDFLRLVAERQI